tara:strand:+ start:77 stop:919 length:843 start_codon:yes stop_codon:yes gene_type:complete
MTLNQAFELMDLLLDKADQPYFTIEEKEKFLSLAISDFININYQRMQTDEDARRALSGCVDYNTFSLSASDIISGYIYNTSYPALSKKYEDDDATDTVGYWRFGNQYALPKQHLYVLSIEVTYYNYDDVINPASGAPKVLTPAVGTTVAAVTAKASDVVSYKPIQVKNKNIRQYYEDSNSSDPFNGVDKDILNPEKNNGAQWSYTENRILIEPRINIQRVDMQTITLPTVGQAFSSDTSESSTSVPVALVFAEHYQRQIVELAVSKMTKVDIGLMTPSTE